jgi:hypothetical protein
MDEVAAILQIPAATVRSRRLAEILKTENDSV